MPDDDPENETMAPERGPTPRRRPGAMDWLAAIISLALLASCGGPQFPAADAISPTLPSDAGVAGTTIAAARKQNWSCPRIEQTIANLVTAMQASKARAEKEEEQTGETLAQILARLSGPPGAGNAALAEFQKARRDADQLNDLLREKRCAPYPIAVEAPAFLQR